MKIARIAFTLAVTLALADTTAQAAPAGYHLVWSDEFDSGTRPDPAKWGYDTRANKLRWWHDEAQYYSASRPENARIENGHLTIEARREDSYAMPDSDGQAYTSARLLTEGKAQWTYGFFEVRAKLPCGRGQWPAIWLNGTGQWPKTGEIDIMEAVGHMPTTIYGTVHSPYTESGQAHQGGEAQIPDQCITFHNYQTEWTAEQITFLIDDKPFYTVKKPEHATPDNWPFDHPEYLILNIAIGGGWGGQQGIDDTAFPQQMQVDYVRVYQK